MSVHYSLDYAFLLTGDGLTALLEAFAPPVEAAHLGWGQEAAESGHLIGPVFLLLDVEELTHLMGLLREHRLAVRSLDWDSLRPLDYVRAPGD